MRCRDFLRRMWSGTSLGVPQGDLRFHPGQDRIHARAEFLHLGFESQHMRRELFGGIAIAKWRADLATRRAGF